MDNPIKDKSFRFAIRIVNLYKYLSTEKQEYVLSKQLLRSGTSIGANISEAQRGQSKPDFVSKMNIALKEANETEYWLRLLCETNYLDENQFKSLYKDIDEIISILMSICKTTNENLKKH
ncbi:MAG: four helix bundle protein [Ruminococcaceae bacterium]|nr:four helix bundle protein [Oscillospiraceae bacterium]